MKGERWVGKGRFKDTSFGSDHELLVRRWDGESFRYGGREVIDSGVPGEVKALRLAMMIEGKFQLICCCL